MYRESQDATVSSNADLRLANARNFAIASQLRNTRVKLSNAETEIKNLSARCQVAEKAARISELKQATSADQLDKAEKRSRELAGRLLRLEEEHEVLVGAVAGGHVSTRL